MNQIIPLPEEVAAIFAAAAKLESRFPGRKFTPDGHLVGSIGEVIAAKALGLQLYPSSHPGHDAHDPASGQDVQIKLTGGRSIALYDTCDRLLVLRILDSTQAEIIYEGDGHRAWEAAGARGKNGQRVVSLHRLRLIAAAEG